MKITLEINTNAIREAFTKLKGSISIKQEKPVKSNINAICDKVKDSVNNAKDTFAEIFAK